MSTEVVIPAPDDKLAWDAFIAPIQKSVVNNITHFDYEAGAGLVKTFEIDGDIYLRVWQASTRSRQVMVKREWTNSTVALSLLYVFNPEFFFLRETGYSLQLNKPASPVMLLIPPSAETRFELASYHTIQLIEIGLTQEFFDRWQPGQFLLSMDCHLPVVRLKMCSLVVAEHLHRMFDKVIESPLDNSQVKKLIDPLINKLITDFTGCCGSKEIKDAAPYIRKLHELEKYIVTNLRSPLPSITELAEFTGLTESSLKRHFKAQFGKGIYQYYLYRKMQLAKLILEEGGISVGSLADEMGYQKVSHFITLFKKHHGYAPGSVIRTQKV